MKHELVILKGLETDVGLIVSRERAEKLQSAISDLKKLIDMKAPKFDRLDEENDALWAQMHDEGVKEKYLKKQEMVDKVRGELHQLKSARSELSAEFDILKVYFELDS